MASYRNDAPIFLPGLKLNHSFRPNFVEHPETASPTPNRILELELVNKAAVATSVLATIVAQQILGAGSNSLADLLYHSTIVDLHSIIVHLGVPKGYKSHAERQVGVRNDETETK
jgi:hypothetical protein